MVKVESYNKDGKKIATEEYREAISLIDQFRAFPAVEMLQCHFINDECPQELPSTLHFFRHQFNV